MTLLTRYLGIDIKRTADRFLLPHAKQIKAKSLYDKAQAYLECSMAMRYIRQGIHTHAHGSPGGLRSTELQGYTESIATSCKRKPFGAAISIWIARLL